MNFCVNCKYFVEKKRWMSVEYLCEYKKTHKVYFVITGEEYNPTPMSAMDARSQERWCGGAGNWFEKKD